MFTNNVAFQIVLYIFPNTNNLLNMRIFDLGDSFMSGVSEIIKMGSLFLNYKTLKVLIYLL